MKLKTFKALDESHIKSIAYLLPTFRLFAKNSSWGRLEATHKDKIVKVYEAFSGRVFDDNCSSCTGDMLNAITIWLKEHDLLNYDINKTFEVKESEVDHNIKHHTTMFMNVAHEVQTPKHNKKRK